MSSSVSQSKPVNEDRATKVRKLVAECLGVDLELVSDKANFCTDLGADWLDRLELMIVIEDQFGVEIADDVTDRMEAVGDLIRFVEMSRTIEGAHENQVRAGDQPRDRQGARHHDPALAHRPRR